MTPRAQSVILFSLLLNFAYGLDPFTKLRVLDGLPRVVLFQPGAGYSVSNRSDVTSEVDGGTLTLKPNITAAVEGLADPLTAVAGAVVSGLLSGALGVVPAATPSSSQRMQDMGPIVVTLPAAALESVYSESNTVDVVLGNFSQPVLRSVATTQNGDARLVVLQLNATSLNVTSGGVGPVYVMGTFQNVTLASNGPGPVYVGSSTKGGAALGTVNVTLLGPPGGGDIVINPSTDGTLIRGKSAGAPLLFSKGNCSVTAAAVTVFGTTNVNVCQPARVQPPPFGGYWKLASKNANASSPMAAPGLAPAAAPGGLMAPPAAAPALLAAPLLASAPVPAQANPLDMSPLVGTNPLAALPPAAAPDTGVAESVVAPPVTALPPVASPTAATLQQIQPIVNALAPVVSQDQIQPLINALAPVLSQVGRATTFFPATVVRDAPAPAPAVQTLSLGRRLLDTA